MFRTRKETQGTALIAVFCVVIVAAVLMMGMSMLVGIRGKSASDANGRIQRLYAAEAGIERLKLLVAQNTTPYYNWLAAKAGTNPVSLDGAGATSFAVGDSTVTLYVTDLKTSPDSYSTWYMLEARAVAGRDTTILRVTGRPRDYFSKYARFVSKGNLEIGDYASYGGPVHTNGNLGIQGEHITFYDDVTVVGKIGYAGPKAKETCTFHKKATAGVPVIDLPEAGDLTEMAKTAPAGSIKCDWNDAQFKADFKNATGVLPDNTLVTAVSFNRDTMTISDTCGAKTPKTWTRTVKVPDGAIIHSMGNVTVKGNISRRTSVVTPKQISVDGPVRYVDDSGGPQWVLKKNGVVEAFDNSSNSWSMKGNWTGPEYSYEEASDWASRAPKDNSGGSINPCLGLVCADTIYITGEGVNREVHAALFTSGDVIRPKVSGTKSNLYILGAIITTGTNPVSSYFSYRCYAYDPHLQDNPPPGFPGALIPSYKNWHVLQQ